MIVRSEADELVLVTQNDHARLAYQILALWQSLKAHPCREALLQAALHHDNGWQEVDAAPPLDATGRPHDFLSLPEGLRLSIWERGTARFSESRPECAFLIVEHALHLLAEARGPQRRDLVTVLRHRRQELSERLGPRSHELAESYPYLRAVDILSLTLCMGATGSPNLIEPVGPVGPLACRRISSEAMTLHFEIEPLPLAGSTTLKVPQRRILNIAYRNLSALGESLARARWEQQPLRLQGPAGR